MKTAQEQFDEFESAARRFGQQISREWPFSWLLRDGNWLFALGGWCILAGFVSLIDGLASGYETWVHVFPQLAFVVLGIVILLSKR
jgi:hypothetical protein